MRLTGVLRSASQTHRVLRDRHVVPIRSMFYNRLRRIIPGTTWKTSSHELELKLKAAQSHPDMVSLMSRFRYEDIVDMARQLSKQGIFNVGKRSLGYREARAAVGAAAKSHPSGAENWGQASESHEDGVWKLGTLRSTVSEADLPTPTSETAMKSFDQLLKDHLETSRPSARTKTNPEICSIQEVGTPCR